MASIEKYEDLIDLPCILILCEKGKMGDSFPKSLRYYDLRLRYALGFVQTNGKDLLCCRYTGGATKKRSDQDAEAKLVRYRLEQDLGRGNCYRRREGEYPVPLILVSVQCKNTLKPKRDRPHPLLMLPPDDCMRKTQRTTCHPMTEADTAPYRELWVPTNKHFDSQWSPANPCTTNGLIDKCNPRRFLLIGMTHRSLHMLWPPRYM